MTLQVNRTALGTLNVFVANTSYAFQHMVDARFIDRLVFYAQSRVDQDVQIQVIGAEDDIGTSLNSAVTVGDPETLPAGHVEQQIAAIGVNLGGGNWHPWLGLIITTLGVAPTGGEIGAWANHRSLAPE